MVKKKYKCRVCGKRVRPLFLIFHILKDIMGGKMAKLIIVDGKLVKKEDVQVVQEVIQNPVVEETKKKIAQKYEVDKKLVADKQREVLEEQERAIAEEQYLREKDYAEQQKLEVQRDYEEQQRLEVQKEGIIQHEESVEAEVFNKVEEELSEPIEEEVSKQMVNDLELVSFFILLRCGQKVQFNVKKEESNKFYDMIINEMTTSPLLKIENKIIPVTSIDMVMFE